MIFLWILGIILGGAKGFCCGMAHILNFEIVKLLFGMDGIVFVLIWYIF